MICVLRIDWIKQCACHGFKVLRNTDTAYLSQQLFELLFTALYYLICMSVLIMNTVISKIQAALDDKFVNCDILWKRGQQSK